MTTDSTDRARAAVQARLAELHWSRARLARESTVDPNTISDFLNGKRVPSDVTVSKLAQALQLTLGTPEGSGEDVGGAVTPRDLADVSDEQLLSELGYRMFGLRREVGQLKRQPEDQKIPLTTRADVTTAARTVKGSPGKRMAQESDMRGEESQDNGDWAPA